MDIKLSLGDRPPLIHQNDDQSLKALLDQAGTEAGRVPTPASFGQIRALQAIPARNAGQINIAKSGRGAEEARLRAAERLVTLIAILYILS